MRRLKTINLNTALTEMLAAYQRSKALYQSTTDTTYTAGGAADTWGRSWTDTELADGTFRLKLDKSSSSDTLHVDYLTVKVYYTISGSSTPSYEYIHLDHLGGTSAVTNASSTVISTVSYYPYGQERITTGSDATDRHFIGQRTDPETSLSYLQNRYYASNRGQFMSEDPAFLAVGNEQQLKSKTGLTQQQFLSDPQLAGSYSYARGNPIIRKDPDGNFAPLVAFLGVALFLNVNTAYAPDQSMDLSPSPTATILNIAGFAAPSGGISNASSKSALKVGEGFGKLGTVIENTSQRVTGYSGHGLNQKITRSIPTSQLLEAAKNPLATLQQAGNTTLRLTKDVGVVLNQAGKVVTSYAKPFLPHVKNVIDKLN